METEIEEKIIIDVEQYENLKGLLLSPDKENWTVAMNCMEHCDHKSSLGFILMLYKKSNCNRELWKETPKLNTLFIEHEVFDCPLYYNKILRICMTVGVSPENIQIILQNVIDNMIGGYEEKLTKSFKVIINE